MDYTPLNYIEVQKDKKSWSKFQVQEDLRRTIGKSRLKRDSRESSWILYKRKTQDPKISRVPFKRNKGKKFFFWYLPRFFRKITLLLSSEWKGANYTRNWLRRDLREIFWRKFFGDPIYSPMALEMFSTVRVLSLCTFSADISLLHA